MGRLGDIARAGLGGIGTGQAVEGFTLDDAVCRYDDGPDPGRTVAVLDPRVPGGQRHVLVMANRVRRHTEVLRDVPAAGHELALHGPDHRDQSAGGPLQSVGPFSTRGLSSRTRPTSR
ncbi:hypothetical protein [Ornithinimicrobium sp. W1665]|uniref:hypothetical protein n=1 Tax=Ornithinimicrobium sp. W1665 TaxID=3416666 RepID=UPI003CEEA61A